MDTMELKKQLDLVSVDKLIQARIAVDDKIRAINKSMKEQVATLEDKLDLIDNVVLDRMNQQGVDSFKTEFGTAFKDNKESYTVDDRVAFIEWVKETDSWNFLPAKVNASDARNYLEQNSGALPPGVKYGCFTVPKFRRPSTKI